jgi:hypothetical protein
MIPRRVIEDLNSTLAWLPGVFSRLAYFATIRDTYTGRYLHQIWRTEASEEDLHDLLQALHQETFDLVGELPLPNLCRELKDYLASLTEPDNPEQAGAVWLELEPYRDMIPQACSTLDRRLFQSRIHTALEILIKAPDIRFLAEPTASQSPPLDRGSQRHRDN